MIDGAKLFYNTHPNVLAFVAHNGTPQSHSEFSDRVSYPTNYLALASSEFIYI